MEQLNTPARMPMMQPVVMPAMPVTMPASMAGATQPSVFKFQAAAAPMTPTATPAANKSGLGIRAGTKRSYADEFEDEEDNDESFEPSPVRNKPAPAKTRAVAVSSYADVQELLNITAPSMASLGSGTDMNAELAKRDAEITRLKLENQRLRKLLKEQAPGAPGAAAMPAAAPTAEELAATGTRLRRGIKSTISAMMVYKPGMKHGGKRLSLEVPNLTIVEVQAVLGDVLFAKATNTNKQIVVEATDAELDAINLNPTKSLRFGSVLGIVGTLKFTYNKSLRTLKLLGTIGMTA